MVAIFDFAVYYECLTVDKKKEIVSDFRNVTCARHGDAPPPSLWWECSSILGQVMENGE